MVVSDSSSLIDIIIFADLILLPTSVLSTTKSIDASLLLAVYSIRDIFATSLYTCDYQDAKDLILAEFAFAVLSMVARVLEKSPCHKDV